MVEDVSGYWIGAVVAGVLLPWAFVGSNIFNALRKGNIVGALGLWAGPAIVTLPFTLLLFLLVRLVLG